MILTKAVSLLFGAEAWLEWFKVVIVLKVALELKCDYFLMDLEINGSLDMHHQLIWSLESSWGYFRVALIMAALREGGSIQFDKEELIIEVIREMMEGNTFHGT